MLKPIFNRITRSIWSPALVSSSFGLDVETYVRKDYLRFDGVMSYGEFAPVEVGAGGDYEITTDILLSEGSGTAYIYGNSDVDFSSRFAVTSTGDLNVRDEGGGSTQILVEGAYVSYFNKLTRVRIQRLSGVTSVFLDDELVISTSSQVAGLRLEYLTRNYTSVSSKAHIVSYLKINVNGVDVLECALDQKGSDTQVNKADDSNPITLHNVDPVADWYENIDGRLLGPELILNPDMDSGTPGWILEAGASLLATEGELTFVDGVTSGARQMGFAFGTELYQIEYTVSEYNGGIIGISSNTIGGGNYVSTVGEYRYVGPCDGSASDRFRLVSTDGGRISRASLREYLGDLL